MTKQNTKVTEKNDTPPKSGDETKPGQEKEIGGFKDSNLPEPTRYGDWEVRGRCSDF